MCGEYGDYEVDVTIGPGDRIMLDRVRAGDGVYHILRHEANTLQQGPFFIYMDVGRWGGNQRQFGLVDGDASASEFLLCAYHPEGGAVTQGKGVIIAPVTQPVGQGGNGLYVVRQGNGFMVMADPLPHPGEIKKVHVPGLRNA